jgi:hypothetical protein
MPSRQTQETSPIVLMGVRTIREGHTEIQDNFSHHNPSFPTTMSTLGISTSNTTSAKRRGVKDKNGNGEKFCRMKNLLGRKKPSPPAPEPSSLEPAADRRRSFKHGTLQSPAFGTFDSTLDPCADDIEWTHLNFHVGQPERPVRIQASKRYSCLTRKAPEISVSVFPDAPRPSPPKSSHPRPQSWAPGQHSNVSIDSLVAHSNATKRANAPPILARGPARNAPKATPVRSTALKGKTTTAAGTGRTTASRAQRLASTAAKPASGSAPRTGKTETSRATTAPATCAPSSGSQRSIVSRPPPGNFPNLDEIDRMVLGRPTADHPRPNSFILSHCTNMTSAIPGPTANLLGSRGRRYHYAISEQTAQRRNFKRPAPCPVQPHQPTMSAMSMPNLRPDSDNYLPERSYSPELPEQVELSRVDPRLLPATATLGGKMVVDSPTFRDVSSESDCWSCASYYRALQRKETCNRHSLLAWRPSHPAWSPYAYDIHRRESQLQSYSSGARGELFLPSDRSDIGSNAGPESLSSEYIPGPLAVMHPATRLESPPVGATPVFMESELFLPAGSSSASPPQAPALPNSLAISRRPVAARSTQAPHPACGSRCYASPSTEPLQSPPTQPKLACHYGYNASAVLSAPNVYAPATDGPHLPTPPERYDTGYRSSNAICVKRKPLPALPVVDETDRRAWYDPQSPSVPPPKGRPKGAMFGFGKFAKSAYSERSSS